MKTPTESAWPPLALPEAPASPRASASCYRRSEDIFVVAVVVPELELSNVQRQIFGADLVERPDDATFKDRPETFNRVRVQRANDIFASGMIDGLMREVLPEVLIADPLVSHEQSDLGRNRLVDECFERASLHICDNASDHITFAADSADDGRLTGACSACSAALPTLVFVAVLCQSADERLIDLHNAQKLLKLFIDQRCPDAVTHIPSRLIASEAHIAVDLPSADAFLAGEHQVNDPEPLPQIDVGILEDCPGNIREAISAPLTAIRALPMPFAGLERVHPVRAAARAIDAFGPAVSDQVGIASVFVRERLFPLGDTHLHDLAGLFCAGHGFIPQCEGTLPC